jgi:hypothetical protein
MFTTKETHEKRHYVSLIMGVLAVNALSVIWAQTAWSQGRQMYSPVVLKKIHAVENNLISWVKLSDTLNFNIYQRMKELNINGAVVAVINNYTVEWVKALWMGGHGAEKNPRRTILFFNRHRLVRIAQWIGYMKLMEDNKVNLITISTSIFKVAIYHIIVLAQGKKITYRQPVKSHGRFNVTWDLMVMTGIHRLPPFSHRSMDNTRRNNAPVNREIARGSNPGSSGLES